MILTKLDSHLRSKQVAFKRVYLMLVGLEPFQVH